MPEGLRQRHATLASPVSADKATGITKFDFYHKVHDDYNVQTKSGGYISVFSLHIQLDLW